jgi:H+/gluconate symporter-like permease
MFNTAMHPKISKLIWLIALPTCLGCQMTRVVLVPSGDPVMLAKPTKASVYGFDSNKKLVGPSTVVLPAGWYALPKN